MTPSQPSTGTPPATAALSLQTYLRVTKRHRLLILGVGLLTAVLASLPAVLSDARYESTAQVRVTTLFEEGVFSTDADAVGDATTQLLALINEIENIRTSTMRTKVENRFPGVVPDFDGPEVTQEGFSEIVNITISAAEPTIASDVANMYAEVFVEDRRNRSVEALNQKIDELREQSGQASAELETVTARLADTTTSPSENTALRVREATLVTQINDYNTRADEFEVEAALRGRGTELVTAAALELDPIKPSAAEYGAIGLVIGLLLGLAVAVLRDTIQDRIGGEDDLSAVRPDVPVLASVPQTELRPGRPPASFAAREAYRFLRTGLRVYGLNSRLRSVLVTSAVGGEGKTTTACNLARAMAATGDRVVLVDCDLRRPAVHREFGLSNDVGLSSTVVGDATLESVTHFVNENLAVIPAGPQIPNPTEVLGSEQLALLLRAIVDQADFTIVDSPPVLPVADALVAGQHIDGVIVVTRIGTLRRRSLRDALRRLDDAGVTVVGLVANASAANPTYGEYGPAYYDDDERVGAPTPPPGAPGGDDDSTREDSSSLVR